MSTLFSDQLFHYAFLETKNIWGKASALSLVLEFNQPEIQSVLWSQSVLCDVFCASLFSTLLTIWSLWQWKRASLQNAGCAASTFQCNERVIVPPRLDALTEQISAAAHTPYTQSVTLHMQEKIGWWTRDAEIKSNIFQLPILVRFLPLFIDHNPGYKS